MKKNAPETLYIVSPCYNEEKTLPKSVPVFMRKLDRLIAEHKVSAQSRLLLVDDGSTDRTWEVMEAMRGAYDGRLVPLRLAENSGEIRAYIAGMRAAAEKADVIVTIDCDLQDDIEAIDEMLALHADGAEIVYGCRPDRSADGAFYRFCANGFYFVMRAFGSKIVPHSSEYRLMTRYAVNALLKSKKEVPFLPAEAPLLGLKSGRVYYARQKRVEGRSRYNYRSLLRLAAGALWDYTWFFETAAGGAALAALTGAALYHIKKRGR